MSDQGWSLGRSRFGCNARGWSDARSTPAIIGLAPHGPIRDPTFVRNLDEFTAAFGGAAGAFLYVAVAGFFENGGHGCFVIRAAPETTAVGMASAHIPARDRSDLSVLSVEARYGGPASEEIEVEVGPASDNSNDGAFSIALRVSGSLVERFDNLTMTGRRDPSSIVNSRSDHVRISHLHDAPPAFGTVRLNGWSVAQAAHTSDARLADILAAIGAVTSLAAVDAVCFPDLVGMHQQGLLTDDELLSGQLELIEVCESILGATAILDPPSMLSTEQVLDWRRDRVSYDTHAATLYYPWIKVFDPMTGTNQFVPPSGHVAGMWARVAATRGIHRSPANEPLIGALNVDWPVNKFEMDLLHPNGINTILAPAETSVTVWGGRTLSSNPDWIELRRVRITGFIRRSIVQGMRWVIHERSDPELWDQIASELRGFFGLLFRAGALGGPTPEQAYSVRCDRSTNASLTSGQVAAEFSVNLDDGSQQAGRVLFVSR